MTNMRRGVRSYRNSNPRERRSKALHAFRNMDNVRLHVQLHRIPPGYLRRRTREPQSTPCLMAPTGQSLRPRWLSLAPVFQNAVMDNLVSATQSLVNEHNEVGGIAPPTLEFLYEKTDSDSPIRQLVLDVAMMHMDVDEIQHTDIREPFNGDFCKALAAYALQYIQSHIGQNGLRLIVPWVSNPLRYYVYQMKKRTIRVG